MNHKKKFRNKGAIGALLDEYEKAINELVETINNISEKELAKIIDFETDDEDCKSIQSILTHTVQSGYNYIVEIRMWLGESLEYRNKINFQTIEDYKYALQEMFKCNEQLLMDYPNIELCENDPNKKINVRWGQNYDVEQLLEHAILHILRHRRQIEKIKLKIS
ncbi:MAG: DinB family protein [Flavobacteriaceae bacterium]|nr:DinB family protein [Flavobacteriaceae bacterium]